MMKKILTLLILSAIGLSAFGQNPKWYKKAKKAQVSILVYDEHDNMRQGQSFILNESGQVLTDYDLMKGATKACIATTDNKIVDVTRLAGASSLYNIVKLNTLVKKPQPMPLTTAAVLKGDVVYIMPTATEKAGVALRDTIINVDNFDSNYAYYKLSNVPDERLTGCPVFNEEGQVIGMLQVSSSGKNKAAYVLSANYGENLQITALDINNADMKNINIPLALPLTENQASSLLYLMNKSLPSYTTYVNDYIQQYPQSSIGYVQKAEAQVLGNLYTEAEQTYAEALKAKTGMDDEIHYSFSKALYGTNINNTNGKPESWTIERALEEAKMANSISNNPIYTAMEGFCLYAMKRYEEACDKFASLSTTNLRSAEYFTYAAQCKEKMGAEKAEILAYQDSAIATFKKPYPMEAANYFMLRAQTLKSMNRYREAVMDYNEYEHLMMKVLTANFYYEREQLELKCRMFEQALNDINHAVTMDPAEPLYRAEQAAANYRGSLFDESIAACKEAIRLDAEFADAYRIWGMCLKQQGKNAEAKAKFQKAIDLGDEVAKNLINELK